MKLILNILTDILICLATLAIFAWPIAGYFLDGYTVTFTIASTIVNTLIVLCFAVPMCRKRYYFWKNFKNDNNI